MLGAYDVTPTTYNYDSYDAKTAYGLVPQAWRDTYKPTNVNHPWDDLGKPQPNRSIASISQPFHKACLSLLYAMVWMEKRKFDVPADFFERVLIVPITYRPSGCDKAFFDSYVDGKPLQEELRRAVEMKQADQVDELFTDGRRFSRPNALKLQQVLLADGPGRTYEVVSSFGQDFNGGPQEMKLAELVVPPPAIDEEADSRK